MSPRTSARTLHTRWTRTDVGVSTAGTMLLGAMAAYVLTIHHFRGRRMVYYLFVSGLAFPVFLAIGPLFLVVRNLDLLDTYTGLILVYIAYALAFTILNVIGLWGQYILPVVATSTVPSDVVRDRWSHNPHTSARSCKPHWERVRR